MMSLPRLHDRKNSVVFPNLNYTPKSLIFLLTEAHPTDFKEGGLKNNLDPTLTAQERIQKILIVAMKF